MKTAVITFICLSVLCAASGQTDHTLDRTARDYVRNHTDRMAEDLQLDDKQRERLYKQNSAHYLHKTTVHNADNDTEDVRQTREGFQLDYDNNLRGILNEEQFGRYEESRDNYRMEYPRKQRATPTREGIRNEPRHGR